MGSTWGRRLKISIFGESHGPGVGVVLDGLPSGLALDLDAIRSFALRRAPGRAAWATKRQEADEAEILSGFFEGRLTGTPLAALIRNTDTRSADYRDLLLKPRPGHADLTAMARYSGYQDPRGSGHFSGRLTAPLVFAGAVCSQILQSKGIRLASHIGEIAGIRDTAFDAVQPDIDLLTALADKPLPVIDDAAGQAMADAIEKARMAADSVGGIVETMIYGMPAGVGDPMFECLESQIASIVFGIPAVRGLEFGTGFAAAGMNGSAHNDVPVIQGKGIRFQTNHSGGIQGGISNGMPIVFRVAFKPTASIGQEQKTINLETMAEDRLIVKGRHDPCVVPRAVPVVEAAAAIAALDAMLSAGLFAAG